VRVPLRDFYESFIFFCENLEGRVELEYFLDRSNPGDVLYDIGGFRGAYSASVKAKLSDAAEVHIFEPLPHNLESLRALAALNHFSHFQINPLAVGDGRPVVGSVNEGDVMLRLGDPAASGTNQFKSISIDEYIATGNPPPTLMKIDVDGFELQVLTGARQCLQRQHPRLWLEVHPTFLKNQGKSVEDVRGLLEEIGYKPVFFEDYSKENQSSYHLWCE
jgi:FkbM family methyltransferase